MLNVDISLTQLRWSNLASHVEHDRSVSHLKAVLILKLLMDDKLHIVTSDQAVFIASMD